MTEFVIDYPIQARDDGLNAIYSGVHWNERKRTANKWHTLVKIALGSRRTMYRKPVEIEMFFNTRMDVDNHGFLAKLIIDGMKGVLIEDDSKKYVRRVSMEHYDGRGILVRVREAA